MKREDVYNIIDSERDYQNKLWVVRKEGEPDTEVTHSFAEWIMFIEDYLNEAKHMLSRESFVTANPKAGVIMRKVAALAVASLEEHGSEPRFNQD